ncbi:amidophosphoribosyltransferase [Candidatus Peregrinibacteria bacterium]|jgi:amidophosphoribosyltransferase|nr:amidophosphoribosyltransferase [Candidatus Peregrinibacteria bacterium]
MCGIIGVSSYGPVNQDIHDGLTTLQHRGQDAAGMVTLDSNNIFHIHKDNGLVRDAIRTRHMRNLVGNIGLGHVRYPTAGSASAEEAQPFYVNSPHGLTFVHNGNLVNTETLAKEIFKTDKRHLNTTSDSEILLNILAHELSVSEGSKMKNQEIFSALKRVYKRCDGAFACIGIIGNHGLLAFRDPSGIRPLIFGERSTSKGVKYAVASESVALDIMGFTIIRDILPGEVVFFPKGKGKYYSQVCVEKTEYRPCIFEHVYLARPDSIIDKVSVHKTRLRMGAYLAEKVRKQIPVDEVDVVIPIPDSGRTAAMELSEKLGIKYREGFIKNRYIGRTFIMPGQEVRKKSIRHKLNPIVLEFKGKNILMVDDSIVRGNTSKKIIQMAREAGAKKVYFVSAAPPVKHPNVYGIDLPSRKELIAYGLNEDEIAKFINADKVVYQEVKEVVHAGLEGNPELDGFEASVFDGQYCTGNITEAYLKKQDLLRSDSSKKKKAKVLSEGDGNMSLL